MANILIIDDSKTSRKILRNLLEAEGHVIVGEAVNGEDGIAKFKELRPDITTLDITMPVLDGLEALKLIMNEDEKAKVVMVTAAGQKNKMVDALKHGATEYISKPFEPEQIISIISKVADEKN
ncbi:two-component system chemotaxis response regulator CheY [Mobilisporobacter senegalensis]|uniref:Stage 0 sporulation protein A homolog n=1 Tax=Mobilisporobacter senegalensis TaxID=1329262 RepID=A0A3N1XQW7_9FIRM|nr:response regulator [Mobilisporobacter senegalensis]ROR27187.1 two-component system chemotaxis response regulator CheY [Mobilisporobacter senegalensis]